MSIESMVLVLHHSTLSGTEKLVLLGIANHEGDGGAWPSIETLARYANVSERSVQRAIRTAVEAGELAVEDQQGGTRGTRGDRRPNLYHVLVACPEGCQGGSNHRLDGATQMTPRGSDGVTSVTPRGDASVANGATPLSPEPSVEPSMEPTVVSQADTSDVPWDQRLANLLADLIEANGSKRPNVTLTWVTDIRRMQTIDGRTPEQVEAAIRWAQSDPFWRANILSPRKLREKYEQMRLQASRGATRGASAAQHDRAAMTGRPVEEVRQEGLEALAKQTEHLLAARRRP